METRLRQLHRLLRQESPFRRRNKTSMNIIIKNVRDISQGSKIALVINLCLKNMAMTVDGENHETLKASKCDSQSYGKDSFTLQ